MLFDVRTYTVKPGTMGEHLALYDEYGREPQFRCLGEPALYMQTETGNPNEYVHIWVYENAADREAKRAALWADPDWLTYIAKSRALDVLVSQSNKLMKPVSFMPPLRR